MRGAGFLPSPYAPWQWNIYLHGWPTSMFSFVGKYSIHSEIQLKKKMVISSNWIHLLQIGLSNFHEKSARDFLDVFTFFCSRNEKRNLQWESILHPPPLYLWAFWICSHCENHDCSNAISSTKNAASGKKNTMTWRVCGLDCHDSIFLLAPNKKRVPPRRNPGCSGIPNLCHRIWIHSISTIFNMFAAHRCYQVEVSVLGIHCIGFHAFKA